MRFYFSFFLILISLQSFAQEEVVKDSIPVDSLYREDQFYFNITYNTLQNSPDGFKQNKFSPGISFGFLRDMPINKDRTFAIALGFGYSSAAYNQNLYTYKAEDINGNPTRVYEIISSNTYYSKSRLALHYLDIPLEIRWRNSTPESHKFWRVYAGFKVSYLINDKYKFANDVQSFSIKNNPDFNKFQYGCYLTAGWNTWNFYAYYGLTPLFKSAAIGNEQLKLNTLNIGLQFYIL